MSAWPEGASQSMVDVVFELDPGTLAADHAEALSGVALSWSSASMGAVIALNA